MITFSMFSSECCLLAWWHVIHQRQYTKNVFLILGDVEYTTCNNFIIFDIIKIILLNLIKQFKKLVQTQTIQLLLFLL